MAIKTQQQFVEEMEGMFLSRGYRDHYAPELHRLKAAVIEAAVYGKFSGEVAFAEARGACQVIDQLLAFPDKVAAARQAIAEDPAEAANVLQSATDADEAN